jgi:hypothetical protein
MTHKLTITDFDNYEANDLLAFSSKEGKKLFVKVNVKTNKVTYLVVVNLVGKSSKTFTNLSDAINEYNSIGKDGM